jgi:UDP-galactopyranose mutase
MDISNYDIIIIGCGFVGSVIAHKAAKGGKRVLITERRGHIAGNMYDEIDKDTGILIQKYGPHSFHTDIDQVYDFITSISEWFPFTLTARVEIAGKMSPSPANFATIEMYYPPEKARALQKRLMDGYKYARKITILELLKNKDPLIREYAEFLFAEDYKPYTVKQWNVKPEDLDISVLSRVPVRFDYIDRYFDDRYQMMPEGGFTSFFAKMLDSPLINVHLQVDALEYLSPDSTNGQVLWNGKKVSVPVVYTGAADELFRLKYGKLPYRSLWFEYKAFETDSFQPAQGCAYPKAEGYTRVTEFTKLPPQNGQGKTIVAYEYPTAYGSDKGREPYYPVLTEESAWIYEKYAAEVKKISNLHICGRLGDFKYYNMDQAVLRALEVYEQIW